MADAEVGFGAMVLSLLAALVLAATPAPRSTPGIYLDDAPLCSLEKPETVAAFKNPTRTAKPASFVMVLGDAARQFGISGPDLVLIERRLGGIILIDVPITATALPDRDDAYTVVPKEPLRPDDYSFAIVKDTKVVFFGCNFTTLP
jgi:hypothetical protein